MTMPEAQPGQEQRMVTDAAICEVPFCAVFGCQSGAPHCTGRRANPRPTASLGEDGELVERLREFGSYPADETARGYISKYIALCQQAADRLILYREALVAARPYVEANASRDSRMTAHHKGADVLAKIDAVLSRK